MKITKALSAIVLASALALGGGSTAAVAATAPIPSVSVASPTAKTTYTIRTVVKVVDGDTVKLDSGATIRLIGIDTPEKGKRGYTSASNFAKHWLLGKRVKVVKVAGHDDRDHYGRYLRYLQRDGKDYGYAVINSGWAIARYDSRTGYDWHPLQPKYIAADRTHAMPSKGFVYSGSGGSSSTGTNDPRFSTCAEAIKHGYGPYRESRDPEYGWYRDADGDGWVCE